MLVRYLPQSSRSLSSWASPAGVVLGIWTDKLRHYT